MWTWSTSFSFLYSSHSGFREWRSFGSKTIYNNSNCVMWPPDVVPITHNQPELGVTCSPINLPEYFPVKLNLVFLWTYSVFPVNVLQRRLVAGDRHYTVHVEQTEHDGTLNPQSITSLWEGRCAHVETSPGNRQILLSVATATGGGGGGGGNWTRGNDKWPVITFTVKSKIRLIKHFMKSLYSKTDRMSARLVTEQLIIRRNWSIRWWLLFW